MVITSRQRSFNFRRWSLIVATALVLTSLGHAGDLPAGARFQLGSTRTVLPCDVFYTDLSPDGRTLIFLGDRD